MHYESTSVLVARSSGSLNFESKTPFHEWSGRRQTGGDGRAAPQRPEIKIWTREIYGFSFMIQLSILPDLSVEFITYLISFTS